MADSLDSLTMEFAELASTQYPRHTKKFMRGEGTKLKRVVVRTGKSKVKSVTNQFINGFKVGKHYKFSNDDCIRVYNSVRHAHLVDEGHRIVNHAGEEKGFKRGAGVLKEAKEIFEPKFESDVNAFVDQMLNEVGLG